MMFRNCESVRISKQNILWRDEEMLELVRGDLAVDDRGIVSFVNDFRFEKIKRFYVIENHDMQRLRGWKGHRKEAKYFFAVCGTVIVAAVNLETNEINQVVLSSRKPAVLHVPPGHANGIKMMTDDAKLIVFSTLSLEESLKDEIRFPSEQWQIEDAHES
jgi:dTDP-4-dehydrorhamnose 3,5-epimerase